MTTPANGKTRLEGFVDVEQPQKLPAREDAADSLDAPDPSELEGRLTTPLAISVAAVTFGSSFQFGYHTGCVNSPGSLITEWIKESYYHLNHATLSSGAADLQWSIAVGIFAVGGMVGGLLSGWMADKFGRKGALLLNNVFALVAAALMTSAKYVDVYYLFTLGRLVIGLSCGLSSSLAPMYLTEVAPINLRGTLGSVCQLLVTVSILIAQILGLPFIWGTAHNWPLIFAFTVVPCAFQLAVLPFSPESPKYNLIVRNRIEQAEKDLKRLRGREDVSVELDVIKEEADATRRQPKTTFRDMFGPALRWPLFIAIMMMLSQQLSGINVAMFYSTAIFRDAGLKGNQPFYATIAMGAMNAVQTLVSAWLVDHPRFGRRSLHLAGLVGMCFSALLISVSLVVSGKQSDGSLTNPWAAYLSIIFVLLFVVSFATGPGAIPWFFVSEIFPSSARGNANSLAVLSNWGANVLVSTSFLPLNNALGPYSFLVFVGFLAFFIAFTWKYVPETKGKTVEEIHRDMAKTR